jgi:Putative neutral zinc metallopeptidase
LYSAWQRLGVVARQRRRHLAGVVGRVVAWLNNWSIELVCVVTMLVRDDARGAWFSYLAILAPLLMHRIALWRLRRLRRDSKYPLPTDAFTWLSNHPWIARSDVVVAHLEVPNDDHNFYNYGANAIVLCDEVRLSRTADAYAVAAHELAHAMLSVDNRRSLAVGRALYRRREFFAKKGYIWLVAATATGRGLWLGYAVLAVALAARLLRITEEAMASWRAMRLLRDAQLTSPQLRRSRSHWLWALLTYVCEALFFAGLVFACPSLPAFLADQVAPYAAELLRLDAIDPRSAAYVVAIGAPLLVFLTAPGKGGGAMLALPLLAAVLVATYALALQLCSAPAGQVHPLALALALSPTVMALQVLAFLACAIATRCLSAVGASPPPAKPLVRRPSQRTVSLDRLTPATSEQRQPLWLQFLRFAAPGLPLAWSYLGWLGF